MAFPTMIKNIIRLKENGFMKKLLAVAASAILISACASAPANKPATAESTAAAIAAAEASNKAASDVGFEWRDTADIIASAKKAAEEKNYELASQLAKQADTQGQNAVKQAKAAGK